MKRCKQCKQLKFLDDFYKKSQNRIHLGDGHEARCKECAKNYAGSPKQRKIQNESRKIKRQTDPEWYAKEKERHKKYAKTEHAKKLANIRNSVCQENCVPEGHHPDYSKPLEVIWPCHDCHVALHWSSHF